MKTSMLDNGNANGCFGRGISIQLPLLLGKEVRRRLLNEVDVTCDKRSSRRTSVFLTWCLRKCNFTAYGYGILSNFYVKHFDLMNIYTAYKSPSTKLKPALTRSCAETPPGSPNTPPLNAQNAALFHCNLDQCLFDYAG